MADTNSPSDTQFLLQSMLQRLRLQPIPESSSTQTQQEVQSSTAKIKQNGSADESQHQTPPMYKFDLSTDSKVIVTNLARPQSPGLTGVTTSLSQDFAKGVHIQSSKMSSTPKQRTLSLSNHTVLRGNNDINTGIDDGLMPKQAIKQKSFLKKTGYGSVSSLQNIERLFHSTHTLGQTEPSIQIEEGGHKRWTQKVKEKWKDRHKRIPQREPDGIETQEQGKVENSIRPTIPVQTVVNDNNTTTEFNEDISIQCQQINNGRAEGILSPLDHMSETLFSPGYFNLMEEIFTGQEWAKFLPSSTSIQSASSSIAQAQGMGLKSSISQSPENEQSMLNQWNFKENTGPEYGVTQSQFNSGRFHNKDTTEYMLIQRQTSSIGMPSISEIHNGQSDPGSNHLESMDLSTSGNNSPTNEHIYLNNQLSPLLSTQQSENQSKATEINNNQSGSMYKVTPLMDLSYVRSKDSSPLKMQASLSRKRGYSTESKRLNEQHLSEPVEMHEWRHNSSSSDVPGSPSSASSTSSLQQSQDSDSSFTTETAVKKRRVENIRHVRFADEVTFIPPLDLSDDDGDADDEDYGQHDNEGNNDGGDELPSGLSAPRWIEALRIKRKPKLKFPRIRSKKYSFV